VFFVPFCNEVLFICAKFFSKYIYMLKPHWIENFILLTNKQLLLC
jgi:hypothetical protein